MGPKPEPWGTPPVTEPDEKDAIADASVKVKAVQENSMVNSWGQTSFSKIYESNESLENGADVYQCSYVKVGFLNNCI